MIMITGRVVTNDSNRPQIERLCVEHSKRSRAEPGCIAHNVHADCEMPDHLVFVELWSDSDAVRAHFAVPASGTFVKNISALSSEPATIQIYRAEEIPASALAG